MLSAALRCPPDSYLFSAKSPLIAVLPDLALWLHFFQPEAEVHSLMQVTTTAADALQHYLDLASDQMKLTAENMANIDTPGYKTQGLDFTEEFSRALNASTSSPAPAVQISNVDGLTARPDGNNVSLDREGMQMAKAQLEFRTGISLLRSEYSRIMSAIHEDSK